MSRLRAAGPSAARTRARWAFWIMIAVNAVMLWFYLGMAASVGWGARALDHDTLQACALRAFEGDAVFVGRDDVGEARYVGDATIRFTATFEVYGDKGRSVTSSEIQCTVEAAGEDSDIGDQLAVVRATVVG